MNILMNIIDNWRMFTKIVKFPCCGQQMWSSIENCSNQFSLSLWPLLFRLFQCLAFARTSFRTNSMYWANCHNVNKINRSVIANITRSSIWIFRKLQMIKCSMFQLKNNVEHKSFTFTTIIIIMVACLYATHEKFEKNTTTMIEVIIWRWWQELFFHSECI